jgi:hypothetical protein
MLILLCAVGALCALVDGRSTARLGENSGYVTSGPSAALFSERDLYNGNYWLSIYLAGHHLPGHRFL